MERSYKSREISEEIYYVVEKFIRNLNKIGGDWMKILKKFRENPK